tara:strand:- start:2071 stop:2991 length:921 start_codon:yes stop_codon:yes gene_type:complete
MKILIIQAKKGMGDMVIYLPYIHAISKKYKKPVSILVKDNSRAKELLAEDNHIDEIISLKKEMDGASGILRLSKEIKKRNFTKIFIFNSSLRYNLIAKLSGVKSIYQYPLFRSKDNIVLSAKIFTEDITGEIISTEPNLLIKKTNDPFDKKFKHICLGISASGPTKRWGIDNYIKLAEEITKNKQCKFYLAGGENDIELINKFKNSKVGKNSFSFEKLNIKETLRYISNCDLYIGNDTGWAHISVALNINALTIFCDSPIIAYGRYSKKMFTLEPEGEIGTTTHDTLGKDKISFTEVLSKANKLLD